MTRSASAATRAAGSRSTTWSNSRPLASEAGTTSLAKGLEFDHVVLLEPAALVAAEADRVTGLRRLYVCLTRAVTSLAILHVDPLPEELGSP